MPKPNQQSLFKPSCPVCNTSYSLRWRDRKQTFKCSLCGGEWTRDQAKGKENKE